MKHVQRKALSATSASAALIVSLLAFPAAAFAQSSGASVDQGPMTVERMHSGFVVAPDVKMTEVDKTTSALAGGYAGWVSDDTIFIGGGGYWLANQASDRKMAYGGLVVQWLTRADRRLGLAAKALVGGGQATLGTTVLRPPVEPFDPRSLILRRDLDRIDLRAPISTRVRYHQGFFVAEPQVDLVVKLTKSLRLTGGVGYRLIDAEGRDDRRLRGATGSVALQIGGGS